MGTALKSKLLNIEVFKQTENRKQLCGLGKKQRYYVGCTFDHQLWENVREKCIKLCCIGSPVDGGEGA